MSHFGLNNNEITLAIDTTSFCIFEVMIDTIALKSQSNPIIRWRTLSSSVIA